jgi:hypothetical protein
MGAMLRFRSVSLEQGCQLCLCGISGILYLMAGRGISKDEIIAEIAPFLFNHPLGLRFLALIVGPGRMEGAMETAAQVGSAGGADILPAHRSLDFQILQTFMAFFHLAFCPSG